MSVFLQCIDLLEIVPCGIEIFPFKEKCVNDFREKL